MTVPNPAAAISIGHLTDLEARGAAREITGGISKAGRLWEDTGLSVRYWLERQMTASVVRRVAAQAGHPSAQAKGVSGMREMAKKWRGAFVHPRIDNEPLPHVVDSQTAAFWVHRTSNKPGIALYVPATSFIIAPSEMQLKAMRAFAQAQDINIAVLQPPLAPEHPFPEAIDMVANAVERVADRLQISPKEIVLCGASSGACLALSAALKLRDERDITTAGLMLFSPWVDLTLSGWSYVTRGLSRQSPFRLEFVAFCAKLYLGETPPSAPLASPLFADLKDLPPILIHASRRDIYFDDAVRLVARALEDNVPAEVNYWNSQRHFLEQFDCPDAARSFDLAGEFICRCLES